jgi:acyl-ACP thioesterase
MPYQVRTHDIDLHKHLTVPALLNAMHETAMQNVLRLKLSVWDMAPDKLAWVLMRLELKVKRPILLNEQLKVITYPTGFEKLFTYRDYVVYDEQGERIAEAASTWILMDTEARKPRRIPPHIMARAADMPDPEHYLPRATASLPAWTDTELHRATHCVGWHDLDFNHHLNNMYYLRWMLDTVPVPVLESQTLTHLLIHYKQEATLGDQLIAQTSKGAQPQVFGHQLLGQDGQLLARASSEWREL